MVKVTIDGVTKEYPKGTVFEEIAGEYQPKFEDMIALVIENGKIRELIKKAEKDCELSFLTIRDNTGHKTYVRTAEMTLVKAVYDVLGADRVRKVKIEFTIGQGYYCKVDMDEKLSLKHVRQISEKMRELVEADLPITKKSCPIDDAMEIFKTHKMDDKVKLFRYRRSSFVNIYCLDGYYDYYYGYMLPSTGYLKYYDVTLYEGGILLLLPGSENPTKLEFFEPREKFFKTLVDSSAWGNDGNRFRGGFERYHLQRRPQRHDSGAGGDTGKADWRDCQKDCGERQRKVCADCRAFLLRQDHLFPQAFHPA